MSRHAFFAAACFEPFAKQNRRLPLRRCCVFLALVHTQAVSMSVLGLLKNETCVLQVRMFFTAMIAGVKLPSARKGVRDHSTHYAP